MSIGGIKYIILIGIFKIINWFKLDVLFVSINLSKENIIEEKKVFIVDIIILFKFNVIVINIVIILDIIFNEIIFDKIYLDIFIGDIVKEFKIFWFFLRSIIVFIKNNFIVVGLE